MNASDERLRNPALHATARLLLLLPILVAAGACPRAGDEPIDEEQVPGHLEVRALYAPQGPEAEDARFVVETAAGDREAGPTSRTGFELAPGTYRVTASVGEAETAASAEVRGGERTELDVVVDAGVLHLRALTREDGDAFDDARFEVLSPEPDLRGEHQRLTGPTRRGTFTLPAGRYKVRATQDLAHAEATVEVRAAGRTETDLVLGAGVLQLRAVGEERGEALDVRWEILSAEEDLRGRHETIVSPTRRSEFILPAGEYLVRARIDDRVVQETIEIEAGTRREVELAVPAVE